MAYNITQEEETDMAEYIYGKLKTSGEIVSINEFKELQAKTPQPPWPCTCPKCGDNLKARLEYKNGRTQIHFAHEGKCSVSPEAANESALHQIAKRLLAESLCNGGKLAVPRAFVKLNEIAFKDAPREILQYLPAEKDYADPGYYICDKAQMEQEEDGFRPDVTVETRDGGRVFLEVFVTNPVKDEKVERALQVGVPMLQIDISRFHTNSPVNIDELRKALISDFNGKEWKVFPNINEGLALCRRKYEETTPLKEYLLRKKMLEQSNYIEQAHKNKDNPGDVNLKSLLTSFGFYTEEKGLPFFVNIPITGEIVFMCDRRIWQSALFNKLVFTRQEGDAIKIGQICDEITAGKFTLKNFGIPANKLLATGLACMPSGERIYNLGNHVVLSYMCYLEELGFLSFSGFSRSGSIYDWATIQKKHGTVPPDRAAALALYEAIKTLGGDEYTSEATESLNQRLQSFREKHNAEVDKRRNRAIAQRKESFRKKKALQDEQRQKAEMENAEKMRLEAERRQEQARQARAKAIKQAQHESERRKQKEQAMMEQAKLEMSNANLFDQDDHFVYDSFLGLRWIWCGYCGCACLESDSPFHGRTKGICRECQRKAAGG